MAQSICFNCGLPKEKVFARCSGCGARPDGNDQLVLSLVLSDFVSTPQQLSTFATDIRAHRKLSVEPELERKAREGLKKILAKRATPSAAAISQLIVTSDSASGSAIAPPIPKTLLEQNPFQILGVTTRDSRQHIVEMAEEKSLVLDSDLCTKARAGLINPRNRLTSEIAWLPGLSPRRTTDLLTAMQSGIASIRRQEGLPALCKANLMASAFELLNSDEPTEHWQDWILHFAQVVDTIHAEDVLRAVNEDRTVSGFPEVKALDAIETELGERHRYYKGVLLNALDKLSSMKIAEVLTRVIDTATHSGDHHAPRLIDDLVDAYETRTRRYLEQEADNIKMLIEEARKDAGRGVTVVTPLIDRLDELIRKWDKVAQPIQLSMKARGLDHHPSREVAYEIRGLGADLTNELGMLEISDRLVKILQEVFAEVPEVAEELESDVEALEGLFKERDKAQQQREQWEKDITYKTELGMLFKDTLRIGPDGVQWKNMIYPLEAITRVRWGGIRNYVNGIPTGTTYKIAFGDDRSEAYVESGRGDIFNKFVAKLWMAVGVRLMTEMLAGLKAGEKFSFGDATVDDFGVQLMKHKFLGKEPIYLRWEQVRTWSASGTFVIGMHESDKTYAAMSYIAIPNVHILEAVINFSFKSWHGRLSGLLDN